MGGGPILTLFSLLLFFAIVFFGKGVRFYTDWLWFIEVGARSVFVTELKARLWVGGGLAAAAFLWLWGHFRIARAARHKPRFLVADDWLDFPQRRQVLQGIDGLFPAALAVLCVMVGIGLGEWWDEALLSRHAALFQAADPVFGKDIGFYVFRLPFLEKIYELGPALIFLGLAAAAGTYVLQRDIQWGETRVYVSPHAQVHLAALAAVFFLWKAAGYELDRYGFLTSGQGTVFGAGYTDLHARLPMVRVLQALAVGTALALLGSAVRRDRRSWIGALALAGVWAAMAALGAGVYPGLLQRLRVVPNEMALERPYIERNIAFTRRAYGLEKVTEKPFPVSEALSLADLSRNRASLANVRLWDHRPLLATFGQLQEIRTYYKFISVDNDRYRVGGQPRQVMLSVREMDHKSLPSRLWINEHLTYTHGYGLVLGPVNEVTPEGLPRLWVRDIPPVWDVDLPVARPEIYFGELSNDYVVVNTRSKELDYPAGDQNVYSSYEGQAGVHLNSFVRKAAFSLRFGTAKLLLSRDMTPESRILFHRQVLERVRRIAPFLLYDSDPYPVLSQGRVFWIVDGYTWTSRHPYSQPLRRRSFNYIRNSVKAVVDAYHGTVRFFVADESDPLVKAYQSMFPGLLAPMTDMPDDLQAHLRYPQDLFEVQAAVYARYHMTDPQVFYNQEDLWTTPTEVLEGSETPMEPYYTVLRVPGESREEYVLMLPFVPTKKSNLIAWMAARSDPPNRGELLVYRFPKEKLVYGPMQIEARIDQDAQISQQFTLWGQRGVQVLRGNLLVLPIENSLLYVEPVYLQAERGKIPELRRVIVAFGERIAMGETLEEALRQVFSGWNPGPAAAAAERRGSPVPSGGREAWAAFQRGQEAVRRGDWAAFGRAMRDLEEHFRRMAGGQ